MRTDPNFAAMAQMLTAQSGRPPEMQNAHVIPLRLLEQLDLDFRYAHEKRAARVLNTMTIDSAPVRDIIVSNPIPPTPPRRGGPGGR